ncbi:MAG: nitroreductase family protein, partial [Clostridia bacterium]|nr:nitroreductase family protein [Clostridia bacterium]
MKDFFDLIGRRESCRDYDPDRTPEREKLENCLEAARLAPSACNSQPWRYLVVTNPAMLAELRAAVRHLGMNAFAGGCPAFAVVLEEGAGPLAAAGGKLQNQYYALTDIGLSVSQFCLAATAQGLSTCIIGWFHEKKLQALFKLPRGQRVRLVIAIGYARGEKLREKTRKPLSD